MEEGESPDFFVYIVANYFTKQTMVIPSPPDQIGGIEHRVFGLGLRFDNHNSESQNIDCRWKLVAILKSCKKESCSLHHEGFMRVGTFDPLTGEWTTEPAKFSEEFDPFEKYSSMFYLHYPPLYLNEALYWVQYWREFTSRPPFSIRYPRCLAWYRFPQFREGDLLSRDMIDYWETKHRDNKSKDIPETFRYRRFRDSPPCVTKLCLKTNLFRLIRLPHLDKRNVGLLRESKEGRLSYCYLCPFKGLRVWDLIEEEEDLHHATTTTKYRWILTHRVQAELIHFHHKNDKFHLSSILSGTLCEGDFLSVLAFNEELGRIVFKVNGCQEHIVCFDFEKKKTVSTYRCGGYWPPNGMSDCSLSVDDTSTSPGDVVRLWSKKQRAPYRFLEDIQHVQRMHARERGFVPYLDLPSEEICSAAAASE